MKEIISDYDHYIAKEEVMHYNLHNQRLTLEHKYQQEEMYEANLPDLNNSEAIVQLHSKSPKRFCIHNKEFNKIPINQNFITTMQNVTNIPIIIHICNLSCIMINLTSPRSF